MKQKTHTELLAKCQTWKSIVDAISGNYQILARKPSNYGLPNIFLIQNKGKGPPGRTRSLGLTSWLYLDNKFAVYRSQHPEPVEGSKTPIENEFKAFIKIKNLYHN
jgi:hypothetical protein